MHNAISKKTSFSKKGELKNVEIRIPKGKKVKAMYAKFLSLGHNYAAGLTSPTDDVEVCKFAFRTIHNKILINDNLTIIPSNDYEPVFSPYVFEKGLLEDYLLVSIQDSLNTVLANELPYEVDIIVEYE